MGMILKLREKPIQIQNFRKASMLTFRPEPAAPFRRATTRAAAAPLSAFAAPRSHQFPVGLPPVHFFSLRLLSHRRLLFGSSLAREGEDEGREDEARAAAAEVRRIDPNFSLIRYAKESPWKEGPGRNRILDALRKAGLK